ncbi:MAG: hypothetical protein WEF51_05310 [Chloroflexota bacterium]
MVALVVAGCTFLPAPDDGPSEVDGIRVLTVTEAIAARVAGASGPIAIGGWFSMAPSHPCPAPIGPDGVFREPNPLELYCVVGDWALSEKPEPVVDVTTTSTGDSTSMSVSGRTIDGPWLQPVLELGQGQIFRPG